MTDLFFSDEDTKTIVGVVKRNPKIQYQVSKVQSNLKSKAENLKLKIDQVLPQVDSILEYVEKMEIAGKVIKGLCTAGQITGAVLSCFKTTQAAGKITMASSTGVQLTTGFIQLGSQIYQDRKLQKLIAPLYQAEKAFKQAFTLKDELTINVAKSLKITTLEATQILAISYPGIYSSMSKIEIVGQIMRQAAGVTKFIFECCQASSTRKKLKEEKKFEKERLSKESTTTSTLQSSSALSPMQKVQDKSSQSAASKLSKISKTEKVMAGLQIIGNIFEFTLLFFTKNPIAEKSKEIKKKYQQLSKFLDEYLDGVETTDL